MYQKTRTSFLLLLAALALVACSQSDVVNTSSGNLPIVTVYKSPTCGCCAAWVDHLSENGFATKVIDEPQMNPLKGSLGVPAELRSCHTATIGDYVIEGHVPAADIHRLLEEGLTIDGLAVPGMPIGSPGMEMGDRVDAYAVIAFDGEARSEFARHGQPSSGDAQHAGDPHEH